MSSFQKATSRVTLLLMAAFASVPFQFAHADCSNFAVVVGEWSNASLQRFDGVTGAYDTQLTSGAGQRINSLLQYPVPNGPLYLGGYEEINVVNAFTGAHQTSLTGGHLSGLTEQMVVGQDGNLYVANEGAGAGSGSIERYNLATGAYVDAFITFPSYQPNGLAQDSAGNWYVSTRNSPNTVLMYNSSGVLQGTVTTLGTSQMGGGLKIYNNELYVINTNTPQTVDVFSLPLGALPATPVRTITTNGSAFVGIGFGPDNNLYLADFYNSRVSVWNPSTGAAVRTLTNAAMPTPHGVGFTTCTPVTVGSADVGLTKVADKTNTKTGDTVKYTLTVTNNGPDGATGVEVKDQLPAGVTFVSASGDGTYDNATSTWTVGSVAVGAANAKTLIITVTVN